MLNDVFTEMAIRPSLQICETAIQMAYRRSTPKVRAEEGGKLPYWWTEEIQTSVILVRKKRKAFQKCKNDARRQTLKDEYKHAKAELKAKIVQSKRNAWDELQ
jgi:hypothetical protein